MNTENINYPELICSLIEEIRLSSKLLANLPECLRTKKDGIMVCGTKYYGDIKIFAMRNDKNGYPQFLVCPEGNWAWVSAKHFTTKWW